MSCLLLVRFTVKEDQVDAFLQVMQGAKARIAAAEGCRGVDLLVSQDHPTVVALSEIWESKELHDIYAQKMRESGSLNKMGDFLSAPPESELFTIQ